MPPKQEPPAKRPRTICVGSGSVVPVNSKGQKTGVCPTCRWRVPVDAKTKTLFRHYEPKLGGR